MAKFRSSVGKSTRTFPGGQSQRDYTQQTKAEMESVIRRYSKAIEELKGAGQIILYKIVEPTYELSQVYCPEDKGDLKSSGYIQATNQFVEVGYARGGKPHYAVYVHEKLENRHFPPTRAKWLQGALEEDIGNYKERARQLYKGVLK